MKKLVILVLVAGLVFVGWALVSFFMTDQNPQIATNLCHDYLDSHAAAAVTFQPDPIVAHDGDVYTISGGADVGLQREGYSCDVTREGDKLVVTHAAFGE